jgi:radical SAM additional 4Fe4S-binding domain
MYEISKNVVYINGITNGAIYNLNTGDVYSIDKEACVILNKIIDSDKLTLEEESYVKVLEDNQLYYSNNIINEYKPEMLSASALRLVWLEITQACNMRCIHCYEGDRHIASSKQLTLDKWKDIISQLSNIGVQRVVVIGGEPCTHKNINDILMFLADNNISTTLFTNGNLLSDELLETIISNSIEVKVSLYGHNAEVHDQITKKNGSFEILFNNIQYLLSKNIKVSIAIVLMKENEKYFSEIKEFAQSLNVSNIKFDVIREVFSGTQCNHIPQDKKIISMAKRSRPNFYIKKREFDQLHNKNTCWYGKLVISEDGNILPCVFARNTSFGNINDISIKELLSSDKLNKYWNYDFSNIKVCKDCEYRYACKDCRPLALSIKGDLTDKNPRCLYNPYTGVWGDE